MTRVTSVRANSSLMSSISFIASYSTSASASNTFMCPGIRPATGWIAYLTGTRRRRPRWTYRVLAAITAITATHGTAAEAAGNDNPKSTRNR
jgi:hypothetical protein